MFKRNSAVLIVITLLVMVAIACGASSGGSGGGDGCQPPADISGSYNVSGTNQDDSLYAGEADISKVSDTEFAVVWSIGNASIQGTGVYENGVFTIDDGEFINTYNAGCDGVLDGTWSQRGVDGQGTEVLTPK